MITSLHILGNDRSLDTYPSIYNALYLLNRAGIACDVAFACATEGFDSLVRQRLSYGGSWRDRMQCLARIDGVYDLVFVYEAEDLLVLECAAKRPRWRRLVHHSLEIPDFSDRAAFALFEDGISVLPDRLLRGLAAPLGRANLFLASSPAVPGRLLLYRAALSRVDYLLIQDELRLGLVARYCRLDRMRGYCLAPNSYIEELEQGSEPLAWVDELKQGGARLVTYIGGIEDWAVSDSLIDALAQCEDTVFVFSGWSRFGYAEHLERHILRQGYRNIVLSVSKKSLPQLNYLIDRSDLGIIFYGGQSRNVRNTGLSSGKYHKFLSRGKPVIVNELPYLAEFTKKNGFGGIFRLDPQDVARAIGKVLADYEYYQANIAASYRNLCGYERHYAQAIARFQADLAKPAI